MSGIESWSTTPANNNQSPPFGWPAGILPSQVEPIGRQMMTSLAAWYQAAEWINYNFTPTYVSATQFTLPGNVTPTFHVGRRVQATDGSTSVYGTISVSAFTTLTTVTVVWDTGVLQTGVTIVYVGIASAVNTSMPAATSLNVASGSINIGNAVTNPPVNVLGTGLTTLSGNVSLSSQTLNLISLNNAGPSFFMGLRATATNGNSLEFGRLSAAQTWGQTALSVSSDGYVRAIDDGGTLQTIGWRDCPLNNINTGTGYTLVLADRGKMVRVNGVAGQTVTIPANASVAFPDGATIVIVNNTAGTLSVAITTDQMFLAGTGTTGTRTIAANGICTIIKAYAPTQWGASGPGVS